MGKCVSTSVKSGGSVPENLRASPDNFETPAVPLGQSGGTATFFTVKKHPLTRELLENRSSSVVLIGKDISRSQDEIFFYSQAKNISHHRNWTDLESFLIPCHGVVENFPVKTDSAISTVSLLLLNRLGGSFSSPRMLDVKIGSRTAVAGWKGKSRVAAWRANRLASLTNSSVQGFRLEGFDHPPESLQSVLEAAGVIKRNRRFQLQRLSGVDIFGYLLDSPTVAGSQGSTGSVVAAWQVNTLISIVDKLRDLVVAVEKLPTQMWIGSSVGLVVDGQVPATEVKIFDWGRSTLALEGAKEFPKAAKYWKEYKRGLRQLLLEAAVVFRTRFGEKNTRKLVIELWDFDVTSSDDFIGEVAITEWPVAGELDIVDKKGHVVKNGQGQTAKVMVDIQEEGGVILVRIASASNLPQMDFPHGTADPMVRVIAGQSGASQKSKVIQNTLNPKFDAEFIIFNTTLDLRSCSNLVKEIIACQGITMEELRRQIELVIDQSIVS